MPKRHTTVSIPIELADEVKLFIEESQLGYDSVSEFVKEAVRIRLATKHPQAAYYIDKLEMRRIKTMMLENGYVVINTSPYRALYLCLSSARRAIISSKIKTRFREYQNYASKYIGQYHTSVRGKLLKTKEQKMIMGEIYAEIEGENPYWGSVHRKALEIGKKYRMGHVSAS